MYLNKDRIRCARLLGLFGSGLFFSAIFLPWWDVGSSEELLNLNNAPAVVADLWGFHFLNPPSWVTSPMPREPSTWQDPAAYCARDAERAKASSVPEAEEEERNETEVQDEGTTTKTPSTSFDASMNSSNDTFNDTNYTNDSNFTSITTTTFTQTRTITSSTITTMTTLDPIRQQELRAMTTPVPDPPLHPGTCELIPFLPTLLLATSALGPGAVLLFFLARAFSSLLGLLAGALAAASACGLGAIALFMAGILSFRGLFSATGPQFVVGGMVFAGGSAVLAVFNSVKALTPAPQRQVALGGEAEDSDDELEVKTPEVIAAKKKEREAKLKLPRMLRFKAATDRDRRKARPSQRRLEAEKKRPEAMTRLLNWGSRKGQGGRFGKKVPIKFLEAAFQEIDVEGRGVITLDQFMATVAKCGLKTSKASFDRVLQEMNQERQGRLDLREFIAFFRLVEDGLNKEARGKSKALMALYLCNFCFFIHVAILCAILIILVRRQASATPEDLEDPLHQAEGQLLGTTLQLVSISLLGFFISVVAVPLLRLTVGSSIGAWCGHFRGGASRFDRGRLNMGGVTIESCGNGERDGGVRLQRRKARNLRNSGADSELMGIQSWFGVCRSQLDVVKKHEEIISPFRSHIGHRGQLLDSDLKLLFATGGPDLEAATPMSQLSRRVSNSSFGIGSGAVSRATSNASRGSGSRPRRNSTDASLATRRTSRASLGSVESLSSNNRKRWWKRLQAKLFPTKRKRRRRASCLEDTAYDLSKFEDANLRAMAATMEPMSTFSPMQVRNLHVAHLPSAVTAAPPTQLAPYLPGTPSGIYSEPVSELDYGRSRPLSRESNGRLENERYER
eukprot:s893_g27.t1